MVSIIFDPGLLRKGTILPAVQNVNIYLSLKMISGFDVSDSDVSVQVAFVTESFITSVTFERSGREN